MHLNLTLKTTTMIPLSQLLTRFKGLLNTEKAKKETVCEEISKIIGVQITHNQVSFSKNTIFIKAHPIIKSEILLKKEEILKKIQTSQRLNYISGIN